MIGIESLSSTLVEQTGLSTKATEIPRITEFSSNIESRHKLKVEFPDISFIERTSRAALMEQCTLEIDETASFPEKSFFEAKETKSGGLANIDAVMIKMETGWSNEIIEQLQNTNQYEILKNAGLTEKEINGRKCLIKENIDLNYADEDGITNRDRISRGLAPLDSQTGKPIELHHLGQKEDSPLVELTEEEHRTGEYEVGKKNQSLWHDNTIETEVHGEGNSSYQERKDHWKARAEDFRR